MAQKTAVKRFGGFYFLIQKQKALHKVNHTEP